MLTSEEVEAYKKKTAIEPLIDLTDLVKVQRSSFHSFYSLASSKIFTFLDYLAQKACVERPEGRRVGDRSRVVQRKFTPRHAA